MKKNKNIVVELVNEWDKFESHHEDADIEAFCRYYLANKKNKSKSVDENNPSVSLMKVISVLHNVHSNYHKSAMMDTTLEHPEAFSLLLGLKYKGETKKTELINMMMLEYTTGIEWINKLIKEGYIIERSDINDRRSKLLHISSKGEKFYEKAYKKTIESARLVFEGVPDEDIKLVLQLLIPIEEKHHRLHAELKNKDFEDIKKVLSTKN